MATAERSYVDPTAQIMQSLLNMGGTKQTTSAGGNIAPLQQVFGEQAKGITPEGATALIQSIFQTGMQGVPQLQTSYGQAVGARNRTNSPLALAMQDMMLKLTQEAQKQLGANQAAAASTANNIATATRTQTQTSRPKASAAQLLPFLLANAGKLKGLKDIFGNDMASAGGTNLGGVSGNDLSLFYDMGAGPATSGGDSFGPSGSDMSLFYDMGAGPDTSGSSLGDFGIGNAGPSMGFSDAGFGDFASGGGLESSVDFGNLFFAEGGLVSSGSGKYVNIAAEKAFNSGGDEKEKKAGSDDDRKNPIEEFNNTKRPGKRDTSNATDVEYRPKKSIGVRLFDAINGRGYANGGMVTRKPAGYADGGLTRRASEDITSVGGGNPFNLRTATGGDIRGVTYNMANDPLIALRQMFVEPEAPAKPQGGGSGNWQRTGEVAGGGESGPGAVGGSDSGLGLPGSVATGLGMASGLVGVPGGLIGMANASNNSQAVASTLGMIGAMLTGNPMVGMIVNSLVAQSNAGAPASTPGSVAASNANNAAANSGMDPLDAMVAFITGVQADSQGLPVSVNSHGATVGGNVGPTGVSTEGGIGVGDSSGTGVGTAGDGGVGGGSGPGGGSGGSGTAMAKGGEVDGPKGRDVIPAYLTDGEYVVRNEVVEGLGVEFFDMINSLFGGPAPGTARGQQQRGGQ